jgi:hypothetical protein
VRGSRMISKRTGSEICGSEASVATACAEVGLQVNLDFVKIGRLHLPRLAVPLLGGDWGKSGASVLQSW